MGSGLCDGCGGVAVGWHDWLVRLPNKVCHDRGAVHAELRGQPLEDPLEIIAACLEGSAELPGRAGACWGVLGRALQKFLVWGPPFSGLRAAVSGPRHAWGAHGTCTAQSITPRSYPPKGAFTIETFNIDICCFIVHVCVSAAREV